MSQIGNEKNMNQNLDVKNTAHVYMTHFRTLISADLTTLINYDQTELHADLVMYNQVLIAYLTGDNRKLKALLSEASETPYLHAVVEARLSHSMGQIDPSLLFDLDQRVRTHAEGLQLEGNSSLVKNLWVAEAMFVQANGYRKLGDQKTAEVGFAKAAKELEAVGAVRKALLAQLNSLIAMNNQDPSSRCLPHLHALYRRAKKVGDRFTASLCLENISREYQLLGALEAALKFARAAAVGFRDNFGHINFYFSILHLVDVLLEIGRIQEARIQLEICKSAPFAEVQSAVIVLESKLGQASKKRVIYSDLNPTWKERVDLAEDKSAPPKAERLAPVEVKLVQVLSVGPRTTKEIAFALYPEEENLEISVGRVKALLARVRKKRPDQLLYTNGKYELADSDTYRFKLKMINKSVV